MKLDYVRFLQESNKNCVGKLLVHGAAPHRKCSENFLNSRTTLPSDKFRESVAVPNRVTLHCSFVGENVMNAKLWEVLFSVNFGDFRARAKTAKDSLTEILIGAQVLPNPQRVKAQKSS